MSIQRGIRPFMKPSHPIFIFASSLSKSTSTRTLPQQSSICKSCYARYSQPRRTLVTGTQYTAHPLEAPPPPPRNTNIPDTSIAGVPPSIENPQSSQRKSQQQTPPISIPESVAQTPTLVSSADPTPSPKPERPKSRLLRPSISPISLTPNATTQLQNLLNLPEPKYIRVGVKNRGCSGLAYHLEYVDKAGAFDEAVEQDGVKVLIDSKALFSIIGSEMDWVEDKLSARFVFRNPNISTFECPSSSLSISIIALQKTNERNRGAMRLRRKFHGLSSSLQSIHCAPIDRILPYCAPSSDSAAPLGSGIFVSEAQEASSLTQPRPII